ncbi:MAG: cation-transporting P-type ATPase, partial [Patescibacteria group bacterium]
MYALKSIDETLASLVTSHDGLSEEDATDRLARFGPNELPEKKRSLLLLFLRQFKSVLVFILVGALALSLLIPFYEHGGVLTFEDFIDAIAIGAILLLNALLGFFEERNAEKSIALLRSLSAPSVRVRREGKIRIISSRDIVPGDILLLEEGDRVSADGRIIAARNGEVDEASLTGESKPARKNMERLSGKPGLSDQTNMVFRGTIVTRGHVEVCITATGEHTELGKIAQLVSEVERPATPLETSMAQLGRWLGAIVLILCAIIAIAGVLRGLRMDEMLLAISGAVLHDE